MPAFGEAGVGVNRLAEVEAGPVVRVAGVPDIEPLRVVEPDRVRHLLRRRRGIAADLGELAVELPDFVQEFVGDVQIAVGVLGPYS